MEEKSLMGAMGEDRLVGVTPAENSPFDKCKS